jgi:hypothetical protein
LPTVWESRAEVQASPVKKTKMSKVFLSTMIPILQKGMGTDKPWAVWDFST